MIKIILAGHGTWPSAMKLSAEMITGKGNRIYTLEVNNVDTADNIFLKLNKLMKTIDYSILVILLDLFGGSPMHATVKLFDQKNVLVISGANLCMLLDLLFIDEDEFNLYEISNRIVKIGRENIVDVFEILKERMGENKE
ncbi:MAG: hypothetical protein QM266_05220 [Bacillota bacterium]|jgi:PTS system mannose-specific IIA component|nr:hypothetical protein [Bacillota bacterium]NLP22587.1 hypothetical protein [Erysipelotrichaceae bacterium]